MKLEARNKSLIQILNSAQIQLEEKIKSDRNYYAELLINLIVEVGWRFLNFWDYQILCILGIYYFNI